MLPIWIQSLTNSTGDFWRKTSDAQTRCSARRISAAGRLLAIAHGVQCVETLNALIQRVIAASTEEIDRAILELQCVRDVLRREGEQVNRDLAGYASLNQHLMTAMKIIAENLKQWRGASVRRATP